MPLLVPPPDPAKPPVPLPPVEDVMPPAPPLPIPAAPPRPEAPPTPAPAPPVPVTPPVPVPPPPVAPPVGAPPPEPPFPPAPWPPVDVPPVPPVPVPPPVPPVAVELPPPPHPPSESASMTPEASILAPLVVATRDIEHRRSLTSPYCREVVDCCLENERPAPSGWIRCDSRLGYPGPEPLSLHIRRTRDSNGMGEALAPTKGPPCLAYAR